jgi:hypothetical protein
VVLAPPARPCALRPSFSPGTAAFFRPAALPPNLYVGINRYTSATAGHSTSVQWIDQFLAVLSRRRPDGGKDQLHGVLNGSPAKDLSFTDLVAKQLHTDNRGDADELVLETYSKGATAAALVL